MNIAGAYSPPPRLSHTARPVAPAAQAFGIGAVAEVSIPVPGGAANVDPIALYNEAQSAVVGVRAQAASGQASWDWDVMGEMLFMGIEDRRDTVDLTSAGGAELTEEMIADLRDRYDLDEMTLKEFHSLLLDLVELGVLSGQDAVGTQMMWLDPDQCSGLIMIAGSEEDMAYHRLMEELEKSFLKHWLHCANREADHAANTERRLNRDTQELVASHARTSEVLNQIFYPEEE